jgi:hypothetical protein
LPDGNPIHQEVVVCHGEEAAPQGKVFQFVAGECDFLCFGLLVEKAGLQAI